MTREIEARLRISATDKTGAAFKSVSSKMDQVSRRAEAMNKRSGAIAKIHSASLAIAGGVVAAGYAAQRAVVDFAAVERQMTRIGNTAGASREEMTTAFAQLQDESRKVAMPLEETISALDTLTASGMNLKEAMDFLPSILATAQASGATTEDIANAGLKATAAFKINAKDAQHAFDMMVAGGQAGQYELKDMAADIPRLANAFATLGYSGEDGLKRLLAVLQTIREDTGTSEEAATAAENIFQKMYSEETSNKFKKFGINLRKEMKKATDSGEDALTAFLRITKQALNGDMTKLPLLFQDTQLQNGMRSLLTSAERLAHYMDEIGKPSVDGTTYRNLQTVLADTQASIDRFNESYNTLKFTVGGTIAPIITPVMDEITKKLAYQQAAKRGMQKRGYSSTRQLLGWTTDDDMMDLQYEGDLRDPDFLKAYWEYRYSQGKAGTSKGGPHAMLPPGPSEFPGGGHGYTPRNLPGTGPVPSSRPSPPTGDQRFLDMQRQYQQYGEGRAAGQTLIGQSGNMDVFGGIERRMEQGGQSAGTAIEQSGSKAADEMAEKIRAAGNDAAQTMAGRILEAIVSGVSKINSIGNTRPPVNADIGRSMPPDINRPGNGGMSR